MIRPLAPHGGRRSGSAWSREPNGDELEGQYVCYELCRRIRENRESLTGIVELYPALNLLGLDLPHAGPWV